MNRTKLRRPASLLTAIAIIAIMGTHVSTFAQGNKVEDHNSLLNSIIWTAPGDQSLADWLNVNVTAAQDNSEYPKPDFSEMEKYYTIVKYNYEVINTDAKLYIVVKPKVEKRPAFTVRFLDADGVPVIDENFLSGLSIFTAVGETEKAMAYTPTEKNMERVKSVVILRRRL